MILVLGLLILLAAASIAALGVATNLGPAHPLGDGFALLGRPLTGHSTGELFLYGVSIGAVGMLGLSMLLGVFGRQAASRGARRALQGSRREVASLRLDRDGPVAGRTASADPTSDRPADSRP